jgi:transcriptional regulator with XRE-family HTH domain
MGNVVKEKRWPFGRPIAKTLPFGNISRMAAAPKGRAQAEALGKRVREAAREGGFYRDWGGKQSLEVAKLARLTGQRKSDISKLAAGERGTHPPFEIVDRLAQVFGVQPRWLAWGKGPKRETTAMQLLDGLKAHPALMQAIRSNRTKPWRVSTIAEALHPETLEAKTRSDSAGTPAEGWAALLDDIERGTPYEAAASAIISAVELSAGAARRLPTPENQPV